ncbi:unnamed protein product [Brassica napus]|uniref:(rape) hypothetical protein n=1 Tax=Brassica napus TaxID=3708 RepID=A0A816MQX8_BRANA|nr:unnamed protein product [Brassica napus]
MAFSKIALLLILNVCANVLDLVKVSLPQRSKCCGLIKGLVDLKLRFVFAPP